MGFNNFLFRLKLFFANKNSTELYSKIFINKIIEKIVLSNKPSYLPDGYRISLNNSLLNNLPLSVSLIISSSVLIKL